MSLNNSTGDFQVNPPIIQSFQTDHYLTPQKKHVDFENLTDNTDTPQKSEIKLQEDISRYLERKVESEPYKLKDMIVIRKPMFQFLEQGIRRLSSQNKELQEDNNQLIQSNSDLQKIVDYLLYKKPQENNNSMIELINNCFKIKKIDQKRVEEGRQLLINDLSALKEKQYRWQLIQVEKDKLDVENLYLKKLIETQNKHIECLEQKCKQNQEYRINQQDKNRQNHNYIIENFSHLKKIGETNLSINKQIFNQCVSYPKMRREIGIDANGIDQQDQENISDESSIQL